MGMKRALLGCFLALAIAPWSGVMAKSYDVLELPAVKSELAAKSLIFTIRQYHGTWYATGHHGHILFSEDGGDSWTQAEVPVRSALLASDEAIRCLERLASASRNTLHAGKARQALAEHRGCRT